MQVEKEITAIVVSRLLVIVIAAVETIYSTELHPLTEEKAVILPGHILYVWSQKEKNILTSLSSSSLLNTCEFPLH